MTEQWAVNRYVKKDTSSRSWYKVTTTRSCRWHILLQLLQLLLLQLLLLLMIMMMMMMM